MTIDFLLAGAGRSVRRIAAGAALLATAVLPAGAATVVQSVTSPGGITAWLVSDDTVPLVSVDFAFRGGSSQDPPDRPGVSNLLSSLLDEGAGDLDSAAFQQRLEETAVRLSFASGKDSFQGSVGMLEGRTREAFELLALALASPRLDADPIERMKASIASGLRSRESDPDTIASRMFAEATFPGHPYAQPDDGTLESLAAITREDLAAFHAATFARDNLVVGVVGAITAEELKPLLDLAFGGLPATARLKPVAEVAPRTGLTLATPFANPQTVIRFGGVGLKRDDPDFVAGFVLNHILGGDFSSRLYEEVREKRGLAYSVWSTVAPYDRTSLFLAGTSTRADKAREVVDLMRGEFARLAADGPTEKELADAKRFLTGNYALRFDSSGKISSQLVGLQLDNLPIDYFQNRNALVEAVTLEDVRRVAKRLLGQPLTVVTVGPETG